MTTERTHDARRARPLPLPLSALVCMGVFFAAVVCSRSWKNTFGLCIGVGAGCLAPGMVLFLDWRRAVRTAGEPVRSPAARAGGLR